jgi:flagellin
MNIYFSTNIPEMRSLLLFNRASLELSEITRRLDTGQRINSGKDDPTGLISRELMRADIKGIQSAQKNVSAANQLLTTAESGLASISQLLIGDHNNEDDNGLYGIVLNDSLSAFEKQQQVDNILTRLDGVIRSTSYNGKQLLDGSMGYRTAGLDPRDLGNAVISRAIIGDAAKKNVNVSVVANADTAKSVLDLSTLSPAVDDLKLHLTSVSGDTVEFSFAKGEYTTGAEIVDAINAKSNETGITVTEAAGELTFETVNVGSSQTFSLFATLNGADIFSDTVSGKDVFVTINGKQVQGDGRKVNYHSNDLTFSATVTPELETKGSTSFDITGGGMLFQLGKDVESSMQHQMGLSSMTTSHLGGERGTLSELRTLDWTATESMSKAAAIINEAVGMLAAQRGQIGLVQKNILDSSSKSLDSQLGRVMESEALISTVDIAMETSRMNRAELLARSAMESTLYSRAFSQFVTNLMW